MYDHIDLIVIGAGISGATVARYWADKGKKVLIFDKKPTIAGHVYDETDKYGIRIQKYGPHIFHGDNNKVWDWVERFSQWNDFHHYPTVMIDGIETDSPFNFRTIDQFNTKSDAIFLKKQFQKIFSGKESVSVSDCLSSSDDSIREWAQFLWKKDYQPYTAKQWGRDPEDIDPAILKRVPIKLSYDRSYFPSKHRVALPDKGYTNFVETMLDSPNIQQELNCHYDILTLKNKATMIDNRFYNNPIVYTGALDQLCDNSYGSLPYRTLTFEWKHDNKDSVQGSSVVAYPEAKGYTRITEYKKLPIQQNVKGTTFAIEYPDEYVIGKNDPYYPVRDNDSIALYKKYENIVKSIHNLYFCGRLADFRYYDMSPAIASALHCAENIVF